MSDIFQTLAAFLFSVGAAGAIIIAISKWLSGLIAKRIEQSYKAKLQKKAADELDLLIRKRRVYASLIKSMRVFLSSTRPATLEEKNEFLRSYDECCLWAPDEVLEAVGVFLDISIEHSRTKESIDQKKYKEAYINCIEEIRKDSGFKGTSLNYRFVSFN